MPELALLPLAVNLISAVLAGVFAAGGAYYAVKTRLHYMEQAIRQNAEDIRELRKEHRNDVGTLHERIDDVLRGERA